MESECNDENPVLKLLQREAKLVKQLFTRPPARQNLAE